MKHANTRALDMEFFKVHTSLSDLRTEREKIIAGKEATQNTRYGCQIAGALGAINAFDQTPYIGGNLTFRAVVSTATSVVNKINIVNTLTGPIVDYRLEELDRQERELRKKSCCGSCTIL